MSDGAYFFGFCVVSLVPFVVLGIRMARAQHHYLSLYKEAHPTVELPEESSDPTVFFGQIGRTENVIRAYFEVQDDPNLETVRLQVANRMRLAFTWGFGVPIVLFIVAAAFGL